jgi:hypothetical protein
MIYAYRKRLRSRKGVVPSREELHPEVLDVHLNKHDLSIFSIRSIAPHPKKRHWVIITLSSGAAIVVGIDMLRRAIETRGEHHK